MSFILDALKKSETERQRQNAPGFADVPDATDSPRAPRWLWVLGGLLAINLIVLLGVMLRPELQPMTDAATTGETVEAQPDTLFSERVDAAKRKQASQVDAAISDSVPDVEGRTASVTGMPAKVVAS